MRGLYILVILFVFLVSCSTVMTRLHPKYLLEFNVRGNDSCYYNAKYNLSRRLSFYPFSVADSVVLVSFKHQRDNYPIKADRIITDSIIERRQLSPAAVAEFTDILYNNFYLNPSNVATIRQCFFPRNAVLFYGKRNRLKEAVLICFHCSGYESSRGKYKLFGDDCEQKMEMIRYFFIKQGIAFGTDLDIDNYPGETFKSEGIVTPPLMQ